MSKNLLGIMLEELKTVRLICPKCKGVVETEVDRLATQVLSSCPVCQETFHINDDVNPLRDLAKVLKLLGKNKANIGVEFIIPAKE